MIWSVVLVVSYVSVLAAIFWPESTALTSRRRAHVGYLVRSVMFYGGLVGVVCFLCVFIADVLS